MTTKFFVAIFLFFVCFSTKAQLSNYQEDSLNIRKFYDLSLLNGQSYQWLEHLSNNIGGRLSGSVNADRAVRYTQKKLEDLELDSLWLQPVMVPKWTRGIKEYAYIQMEGGTTTVINIAALGGSEPTPSTGLRGRVIEVNGIEDLENYGKDVIAGKIVFFNRAMPPEVIQTFEAYAVTVDQRYSGALEAAKYGAAGVIVRSLSHKIDEHPHTGSMDYGDLSQDKRIPAATISTKDADYLSGLLSLNDNINLYIKMSSENHGDVQSHNVIGEIKGSEFPEEIIVVGAHLDSWDLGDGAHDDGAGVVQSMEVLRLFKKAGIHPKRTIRVVLFMNEENGLRGAKQYAKISKTRREQHIFALESDAGGFSPLGFSFDATDEQFSQIESWKPLFEPYFVYYFGRNGSGADILPLKDGEVVLAGLRPDSQRYFDYHHSASDTFETINRRELEMGAASMASLVYLVDKYGLANPKAQAGKN